ncbi:steroid delta-isomerase [Seongchinamella unica]|uniref:Steroid delta-isomerase n=1 Tax=Seongchinamella unica TaxID=2547392 RepID=A0A4R5LUG4_9GAMM|nr:nuclear transport factor 2 family protein [Seongchinamella unica]TDG15020.1 steroid delta-isomerase [Seongchinamella unica]
MDNTHKIATVHKYVEAFANSDIQLIREIYAEDAVVEDPVGSEPHVGIDAVVRFYEGAFATGARLALTGDVRCAGNAAAFPFKVIMEGIDISPIDVFEFNDAGKVVKMKAYWGG